jgi:hypothetical protein
MSLEWELTVIDAHDPYLLGMWWRDALGWVVVNDAPDWLATGLRASAEAIPHRLSCSPG